MSRVKRLWDEHGQAVWLDFIQRSLLEGGGLARMVADDGIRGLTSNPTIFDNAIGSTREYDEQLQTLCGARSAITTSELYEELAISDIRAAADLLRPLHDSSDGADGFVSLEVSPHLAHDANATVAEARRVWRTVQRPNLMVKVPATKAGAEAIPSLIAEGVNVNATLLFSLHHYDAVVAAYLAGLERCEKPHRVASVASFFVSRVDTAVDAELERNGSAEALAVRGRAAVANAGLAYRRFLEVFHSSAFAAHRNRGARVQRPLWASTSTKNKAYPDTIYVDELIAKETVNTIPLSTLTAFADHGTPRASLEQNLGSVDETLTALAYLGVDLDAVTERLQVEGVAAFAHSFDSLLATLESRRREGR